MVADYKHVDSESGKAVWYVACRDSRYGDSNGKKRVRASWTNGVAWPGIGRLALWQRGTRRCSIGRVQMSWWLPCVLADKKVLETDSSWGVASSALTRPEMVGR
jgi:hypothetical protein